MDFAAVSHHVVNKMRGALHEETVYGKDYGDSERHVRVDLASCTPDDIAAKEHALEMAHFPQVIEEVIRRTF